VGYTAIDALAPRCVPTIVVEASRWFGDLSRFADVLNNDAFRNRFGDAGGALGIDVSGDGASSQSPADSPAMPDLVVTASRLPGDFAMPADFQLAVLYNVHLSDLIDRMYRASTQLGEAAVEHYVSQERETGNPLYRIPGAAAALWTPSTAPYTSMLLGVGSGLGRWSARPYWKYTNSGTRNFTGPWLARGNGWDPPYGERFPAAQNALQIPQIPRGVVRVDVPHFEFVAGPRPVAMHPEWGDGGGSEYFRGWSFPE
jgi:hypothetical protein